MKKQIVQFHAIPIELVDFTNSILKEFNLNMVLMNFEPLWIEPKTKLIASDLPSQQFDIYFSRKEINLKIESKFDFLDLNPGVICLSVGQYSESELQESVLSSISTTDEEFKLTKKIIYRLKKLTQTGGYIIGKDGKEYSYPNIRYTQGAKELYDKGVKMLAYAGTNSYEFGK